MSTTLQTFALAVKSKEYFQRLKSITTCSKVYLLYKTSKTVLPSDLCERQCCWSREKLDSSVKGSTGKSISRSGLLWKVLK